MAASIVLEQKSGIPYGAVIAAKTVFYFVSVDDCLADYEDYGVQIIEDTTNYSYEVWIVFRCDLAPTTKCDNFKLWTVASLPTGNNITVNSSAVTVYITPTDDLSVQGTRADLIDYNAGNKLSIGGALSEIGDKSNFMVFQLEVTDIAGVGDSGDFQMIYSYDES